MDYARSALVNLSIRDSLSAGLLYAYVFKRFAPEGVLNFCARSRLFAVFVALNLVIIDS